MMNTPGIFVGMAVIGALGFILNWSMGEIERRVMPWK
jgi:ABC-type nitrate/sulfonate/bicarbonate transport system permease component